MSVKTSDTPPLIFGQTRLIACCLMLPGLYFIALFVYVVLQRIHYPLELELIEGSTVNHALRILHGEALYQKPAFEFTPNLYTPFFYYCGAAISSVMGIGFFSVRLVSVLAALATFIVIAMFVYRETTSRVAAFTAAGMYAATYAASGGWMDLARVDSLFLVLLLMAIYWMRYAKDTTGIMISAILFVLAFYTKQSALIAAAPLMLYAMLAPAQNVNRFLLPFVLGGLLLCSLGLADWLTGRWFTYYTLVMPAGHPDNPNNVREFWRHDLILVMPVAIGCALLLIVERMIKKSHKDALFFALFLFAMVMMAYLTRINKGGYYNNLMPAYAALAILLGIFVGKVWMLFSAKNSLSITALLVAMIVVVYAQFCLLSYNPQRYIPGKDDWSESERLIADLRAVEGNIYSLDFGFTGYLAGKTNFSHSTSMGDIKLSRYQYWAETDLQPFANEQLAIVMAGINKNNVRGFVLFNERGEMPPKNMGDFVFKKHYVGKRHAEAWSPGNVWVRSWPTRTMFARPDTVLYISE